MIQCCLDDYPIDKVVLIPTYLSPHKTKSFFSGMERLNMLKAAQDEMEAFFSCEIVIDDYEVRKGKPSYTSETLKECTYSGDKNYFVMGSDSLLSLHTWKDIATLFEFVDILVVKRDSSHDLAQINSQLEPYKSTIHLLENEPVSVSSTEIRSRLNRMEPIAPWLPDYIKISNR